MSNRSTLSRRELLRVSAFGAAGSALVPALEAAAQERPYGPFRMGIQSYSLRGYKVDEALQKTKDLGLRYWESYTAHIPLTTAPAEVKAIQDKLTAANVRLRAYGVMRFTKDDAANRKMFEGAKALGIRSLSADPDPDSFDSLEKLVEEFQISIAIHNHGPGHRYNTLEQVQAALKGRGKLIGACVDTGHFLRTPENPVKVIEAIGDRVYGVHLKDVKGAKTFTILGEGDLDVVGTLKALRAVNYRGVTALEYEENPQNPIPDLEKCLVAVKAAVAKL